MAFGIAERLLLDIGPDGIGKIHTRLVRDGRNYPENIGKFVGKVKFLAGFGRLVAVGPRHYAGHLADFLRKNRHVGERRKISHSECVYPLVDQSLKPVKADIA